MPKRRPGIKLRGAVGVWSCLQFARPSRRWEPTPDGGGHVSATVRAKS